MLSGFKKKRKTKCKKTEPCVFSGTADNNLKRQPRKMQDVVVHALGPKAGRQKQADLVYILNSKPTKDRVLKK